MVGVKPSAFRARCALLGAVAVVAGCGSGSPDSVTDRDATLRLRLDEYRILPGAIKVRAGRIRIIARNDSEVATHNVKVEEATDVEGATPIVYASTKTMQPGETARKTLRLLPGRYRLVCTIGNHENLGQYAELEVTRAGS